MYSCGSRSTKDSKPGDELGEKCVFSPGFPRDSISLLLKHCAAFLPEKYFRAQNWWGWLTEWM